MRAIYNGIDLLPIETHEYFWESVYDDWKLDYLYTRVSMLFTAIINSQSITTLGTGGSGTAQITPFMNYDFVGPAGPVNSFRDRVPPVPVPAGPGLAPPAGAGVDVTLPDGPMRGITNATLTNPINTLATIRHRLQSPRGQLFVFAGPGMETGAPPVGGSNPPPTTGPNPANINLISPKLGSVCDAKNGPIPRLLGVTTAVGDAQTLVVDWGCETFINEAATNGVSPSGALVSNRFSQTHAVDDDSYTALVTEGTAIFRTDLLAPFGTSPDSFRAKLFMPVPQGFTRVLDYVRGRPDISGVEYRYTDYQQHVNFVAGPYASAAKIAAVHRQQISAEVDLLGSALNAIERTLSLAVNTRFATARDGGGHASDPKVAPKLGARLRIPGGG